MATRHLEEDSLLVEVGVAVRDAELVHLHVRPQVLDHLGVRRRQDLVARARQGCPRLANGPKGGGRPRERGSGISEPLFLKGTS